MMPNWLLPPMLRRLRANDRRRAGDAARDARDWAAAAAAYEAYLAMRPDDWSIRVQLGHACKEGGELAAAERAYRRASLAAPDDADAALQLGHALKLMGRREDARDAYRRSAKLAPEGPAVAELAALGDGGASASSRDRDMADAARDAGRWLPAARHYSAHLKVHPKDQAMWVQLGNMLKEAGKLAEAERAYREAIRLDATGADAFLQLGHLLGRRGNRDAAIEAYRRSLELDPGSDAGRELVALGAMREQAITGTADLLDWSTEDVEGEETSPTHAARWRVLLDAEAARDHGRWDEAATLYRTYVSAQPDAWQAWADLAFVLRQAGHPDEAHEADRQAAAVAPAGSGKEGF